MPDSLADLSCRAFSEQLFSNAPGPGGGGTAALIGSLAASLGGMAANLTIGKKNSSPLRRITGGSSQRPTGSAYGFLR